VTAITRLARALVLFGVLLAAAGCNTIAGLGQDVAAGARTVQRVF
jgi:predicted small secreted protein